MSIDPSLHLESGVTARRNVLKRAERIAMMVDNGNFDEESDSPIGLAKTRIRVRKAGSKAKKEEKPEAAEGATDEAAAGEEAPAKSE